MPAIICAKHGHQLATLVCPHVAERYNHGSPSDGIMAVHGTWIDPTRPMVLFWCCPECTLRYGFCSENQPIDYVTIAEDFETSLVPICSVCFEAWRISERGETAETG